MAVPDRCLSWRDKPNLKRWAEPTRQAVRQGPRLNYPIRCYGLVSSCCSFLRQRLSLSHYLLSLVKLFLRSGRAVSLRQTSG